MARPDITELGESLLSGKIERVRKQEKRAEKSQRRAQLVGLGLQLGAGAVQSFFQRKDQDFQEKIMNSETQRLYKMTDLETKEYLSYKQNLFNEGKNTYDYEFGRKFEALEKQNKWVGISNKAAEQQRELNRQEAERYAKEQAELVRRLDEAYASTTTKDELANYLRDKNNRPTNILQAAGRWIGDKITGQSQDERDAALLAKLKESHFIPNEDFITLSKLWDDSRNRTTKAKLIESFVEDPYAPIERTTGIIRDKDGSVKLKKERLIWDEATGKRYSQQLEDVQLSDKAILKEMIAAEYRDGDMLSRAIAATNPEGREALAEMHKKANEIDDPTERSAAIVSGSLRIMMNNEFRKTEIDPVDRQAMEMLQNAIRNDEAGMFTRDIMDESGKKVLRTEPDIEAIKDYYDSVKGMMNAVLGTKATPEADVAQSQKVSITDDQGNTMTASPVEEEEEKPSKKVTPESYGITIKPNLVEKGVEAIFETIYSTTEELKRRVSSSRKARLVDKWLPEMIAQANKQNWELSQRQLDTFANIPLDILKQQEGIPEFIMNYLEAI